MYFRLDDSFLRKCNLYFEELEVKESRYPVVAINFSNVKKLVSVDRDVLRQAIENIFSEIAQIFLEFYAGNFQLDLGTLGKFLLSDRSLRFLPSVKIKKAAPEKRLTVKNLIDLNARRANMSSEHQQSDMHQKSNLSEQEQRMTETKQQKGSAIVESYGMRGSHLKSVFSSQGGEMVSPTKRSAPPPGENQQMNLMFGAGTDPLALNQNFSTLAGDSSQLIGAVFQKPPYARIRCPPVLDLYSRTKAAPVASQYNSLSASSRVGLFYSPATKYLSMDPGNNEICYLKIRENKTKLTANEELLQAMATEREEIEYLASNKSKKLLQAKIEAKLICYRRYKEYIENQIPLEAVAPIRQYWITNVLDLIPADQEPLAQEEVEAVIDRVLSEIDLEYKKAVKKSILDYILRDDAEKLRVGILQRFDEPIEYGEDRIRGVVADQTWVDKVAVSRAELREKLVNYHHATLTIVGIWAEISKDSFLNLPESDDPREIPENFLARQRSQLRTVADRIKGEWIQNVAKTYQNELGNLKNAEIARFFTATKILMSNQLRDLIYRAILDLKQFIGRFEKENYLTPQQCIEADNDRTKPLQPSFLTIGVIRTEDRKIRLKTKPSEVRNELLRIIDEVVEASKNVALPQNKLARSKEKTLSAVNSMEDDTVLEVKEYIDRVLTENIHYLDKVVEVFAPYEYLLSEDQRIDEKAKEKRSLTEYDKMITNLRNIQEKIDNEIPFEIYMNLIMIDCREIKDLLIQTCDDLVDKLLQNIKNSMVNQSIALSEDIKSMFELWTSNTKKSNEPDADYYKECEEKRAKIDREEKGKAKAQFDEIKKMLEFLYENRYKNIEDKTLISVNTTAGSYNKIEDDLKKARDQLTNLKEEIKKKLVNKKKEFDEHVKLLGSELEKIKVLELAEEDTAIKNVEALDNMLKTCKAEAQEINYMEEKIGVKRSGFDELDATETAIVPFNNLWTVVDRKKNKIDKWEKEPIFNLDAADVIKTTRNLLSLVTTSISQFESVQENKPTKAIKEANELKKKLLTFQDRADLLNAVCSKAMQDRHWESVTAFLTEKEIDMAWNANSQWKLKDCENYQIFDKKEIKEKIKEISERAEKEFKNFKILEDMEAAWEGVNIAMKGWKDTGSYAITGDSVDEIQTLLDEHIIQTQTMKGSQFAKYFETRINKWEVDMLYMRDTLELWLKVQANWIYLQPIFSSPDIKRELQAEDTEFQRVNSKWRDIMSQTLSSNRAIDIPKDPARKDIFKNMLSKLEHIQEKLIGYLNLKRSLFPRFYFLSEDSLIEVLSEARDATKIQKYCKILFEGIKSLEFSSDDVILGMKSSEGEYVKFEQTIPTRTHEGLVEAWLQILEDTMVLEVRRVIEEAFIAFNQMPREEFVMDRAAMAVLDVDMTDWTRETERAIEEGRDGLPKYYKRLGQELLKIVSLVKKQISPLNRLTLEALIVLDVHNQQVVRDLISARVQSITDFDYEAQLRYYWDIKQDSRQHDTIVKMINTTLDYNYEYLGNSSRLVITPLTDRCYRTLCGAIGLNYGGAPEGPAGTGKTETVKDLAKALARMIVVFNCSDNLNYTSMARFFKGLCCTGGWSCFDEFNRIKLEVLSVIAQQLQCIQNAIKDDKTDFEFEGSVIRLKKTCNCFITMNPGYAGRSELPDNLKALFRSVAMMVPDYALIGEIRLYSFGFSKAQPLAKKIVTTYKLCSEQISAQKHYDYGMRAVNSVLVAAGNLRKVSPTDDEDIQILRAINEVNEAKFLDSDLPLFKAITEDLFPETKIPEIDLTKLTNCLKEVIDSKGLQSEDYFIAKIIQIYQMILVRHGLMVVGDPYGGKTSAIEVLADALGVMSKKYNIEKPVETICINPKAITGPQLYGITDIATNEWTDGVLPVKFKKMANDEPTERKWLWFDGPVDAVWIEDMNTVLDENKKLCLANGDIFYMSAQMNLIFEPMDLLVASPATVSRCGMILMEPHIMGWYHLYKSWKLNLSKTLPEVDLDDMDIFFSNIFTPLVKQYELEAFEVTAPTMIQNIVTTLLKLASPFILKFKDKTFSDCFDAKEKRSYYDKVFAYATTWSMGATLTSESRQKFDAYFKKISNSPDPSLEGDLPKRHRKVELPEGGSGRLFEFYLDYQTRETGEGDAVKHYLQWNKWSDILDKEPADGEDNPHMQANEMIVNTVDLVRYRKLVNDYISLNCNVLVCGPTGTGKTVYIKRIVSNLPKDAYQTVEIGFSAQTTALQVQNLVDSQLTRRSSKGIYGPPIGKKMIVFVDDLGMPKKEEYGAQPPIELLRQLLDKGGWYDLVEKHKPFKHIQDLIFIAAMGPPSGGRNTITPRFRRLLCFLSFTKIENAQMEYIFRNILTWRFEKGKFEDVVLKLSVPLVKATSQVYTDVTEYFKPLPTKSHYLFNLRDFARVIFGICLADKDKVKTKEMAVKLWIHEVWRVFGDRLNSTDDRLYLLKEILKKSTHKCLGENFDNLLLNLDSNGDGKIDTIEEMRGLIFTDVMSSSTLQNRPYEMVQDQEKLLRACEAALQNYDLVSEKPLNIVLFNFAIEHLLIISRILKQPGSNALLVGIGGSGRQSLTKLAAKIADYGLFQIELSKSYGEEEWKEDLKEILKSAGGKAENTVFLFRDSQIKYESFIEDINNLLNNGEVPNLFAPEDKSEIMENSRKNAKQLGIPNVETPEQLMQLFTDIVKKKLHVVLCFSPIGGNFRNKIRMFPSLVNCCTIDWFFEWPQEALVSVAQKFIGQIEMENPELKDKCVDMVKFFHVDTQEWADNFYKELKRKYYVTPTSYIDMISQFKSLLDEKTDAVTQQQQKYEKGYEMIIEADISVENAKAELKIMAPKLEEAKIRVNNMVTETEIKKQEAEVVKLNVSKEKVVCSEVADKARAMSDECKKQLEAVLPEIMASLEKLASVEPSNFDTLKSQNVALPLLLTSQCLAIILGQPEIRAPNPQTMKHETDWKKTTAPMYIQIGKLIDRMKEFNGIDIEKDKENFEKEIIIMDEKTFNRINKLFEENPKELEARRIQFANPASSAIFDWIEAQKKLYPAELDARPMRKKYIAAKRDYDEAKRNLDEKERLLKEKEQELDRYTKNLEEGKAEQEDLENRYNNCKMKLERSEILIENLRDEKVRWKELAEKLKVELGNLIGDVLISSAVIAYLGPFTSGFRSQIISSWEQKIKEVEIPGNEGADLVKTFGDPVQIRNWQIKELPSDDFSTENAIILSKSRRWSLCIDPQLQANKWIKNMNSEKLVITNLAGNFMKDIERAIRNGLPCLLENVGEEIDASLDPILLKQITGQGLNSEIKLGDKTIDYNHSFFLYITTKERNPHYMPEVSTKVTLVNFMITSEGLSDQLLGIIVKEEMPEKEAQKVQLITEGAANKEELIKLENEILKILAAPKEQLLEDETAINILTMSKKKSNDINEKQKIAEETEKEINAARKNYEDISRTSSCLFFAISDLNYIDTMYQYSLSYFIELFRNSILKSEKPNTLSERLLCIENHFLYSLYLNISRSLFVRDKLLFSFLLSIRIKQFKGDIKESYYRFFLTGNVGKPKNLSPKPAKVTWLTDIMWTNLCRLSEFEGFENIHNNFVSFYPDWNRIYQSQDPINEPFPDSLEQSLSVFEKMLVMKIIRPEKIVPYIQKYIISNLGQKFVDIPAFDLEQVYQDSTKTSPLIFILTPGVDPFTMLKDFADKRNIGLAPVSLGQGQGELALRLIHQACEHGTWVVLQNCHLAESFMLPLEKKCDEMTLNPSKIHENFRLWLTSYPSSLFPSSVLQNGVKMTNQPPSGLKNNLKAAMMIDEISNPNHFNKSSNLVAYRRLVFGLCFFHSVIQERRKYGPLGWNIPYEFTESDLRISAAQLRIFINKYPDELPLAALKYLTAECNYGGRVTDDKDRRLIKVLLEEYYCKEAATYENYELTPSHSEYFIPSFNTYTDYLQFIDKLPMNAPPGVYGFNTNANITKELNETKEMIDTLMLCQGGGGGSSSDDSNKVGEFIKRILTELPQIIDEANVKKKYMPSREESMNTILQQEVSRYNKLISIIRASLVNISDALDGKILFSFELEQMLNSLNVNKVPKDWMDNSYPSLKPLASYIQNLKERIEWFNKWIENGIPAVYWIGRFFFPQGFLTGIQQNYARKYTIAIDKLVYDFEVVPEDQNITAGAEDGAYVAGYFLEGAKFDYSRMSLGESDPKKLFVEGPTMYFKPALISEEIRDENESSKNHYECPLYRTGDRRGVLLTTGHSTNFVMMIKLPSEEDQRHWIKRGVAAITQLSD